MLLQVYNLTKTFKRGKSHIVANDNISFSLEEGDILGILGPNGAGKTTLIKQIATLLIPDKGEILYRGNSVIKHPEIIRGRFSFLLEGAQNVYPYLTGEANLLYFAYLNHVPSSIAKKRTFELLKRMGLYDVRDRYVFEYSSGMKKKLAVATCLVNDPEIIFLDEPLSGLDIIASEELIEFIKNWVSESNKTFMIASHRMGFIEKVTDKVLWIKEGKIILSGKTKEMKNIGDRKEFILYVKNSTHAQRRLKDKNIEFEALSKNILTLRIFLPEQNDLFSYLINNLEVLNIEKKELDFEKIFKELYHDKHNQSRTI